MEINKGELDRYITGNYGEDQFRGMDECPLTGDTECEHLDEHEIDDIQGTKPACFHPDVPSDTLIPLICPLKDKPTVQQILTELVSFAYGQDFDSKDNPDVAIAITNAAEQIRQQEWERLEKVMRYATHRRTCAVNNHPSDWCNCGYNAALKELEATYE